MRPGVMWTRTDWLPELQIVEWPRLEDLRKRHVALAKGPGSTPTLALCECVAEAAVDLIAFWDESRVATEKAKQLAGYDPENQVEIAEPPEEHEERFVHVRDSLSRDTLEARNALVEAERAAREAAPPAPSTIDAINAVADKERRERERANIKFGTQRRQLTEDFEALMGLRSVTLAGSGVNVLAQVAEIYPDATPASGVHRHLASQGEAAAAAVGRAQ